MPALFLSVFAAAALRTLSRAGRAALFKISHKNLTGHAALTSLSAPFRLHRALNVRIRIIGLAQEVRGAYGASRKSAKLARRSKCTRDLFLSVLQRQLFPAFSEQKLPVSSDKPAQEGYDPQAVFAGAFRRSGAKTDTKHGAKSFYGITFRAKGIVFSSGKGDAFERYPCGWPDECHDLQARMQLQADVSRQSRVSLRPSATA